MDVYGIFSCGTNISSTSQGRNTTRVESRATFICRLTVGVKPHGTISGDELKETFTTSLAMIFGQNSTGTSLGSGVEMCLVRLGGPP